MDGMAWFATIAQPQPLKETAHSEEATLDSLMARFGDWHSPIRQVLECTPLQSVLRDVAFALPPFDLPREGPTAVPRVALVGDAAHALDPVLAQGTGIAIEDGSLSWSPSLFRQSSELLSFFFFPSAVAMELAFQLSTLPPREWEVSASISAACSRYERRRRGRIEALRLISDISQELGQMNSETEILARDAVIRNVPQSLKGFVFDEMLRWSLATTFSPPLFLFGSQRGGAYEAPSVPRK
jgi:2-polyprenyl-6-methoxyphenol hydroxylase-like FAD-dependent oxidoreductase